MTIVGHHHISMYTKDAVKNKAFYTEVLGLRLVEKQLIKIILKCIIYFMVIMQVILVHY